MKLAIFGASGRTGKVLVEKALAQGHEMTALVRDPAKIEIKNSALSLIQGDARNASDVEKTIQGADAVISVISGRGDTRRVTTRNILDAMKKYNVRRLVSATGAGVSDPTDQPTMFNHIVGAIIRVISPDAIADGNGHVEMIRASDRDWIIVRAPFLTDAPGTGKIHAGNLDKTMGRSLTRADLSDFILQELTDNTWLHKAPVVTNKNA